MTSGPGPLPNLQPYMLTCLMRVASIALAGVWVDKPGGVLTTSAVSALLSASGAEKLSLLPMASSLALGNGSSVRVPPPLSVAWVPGLGKEATPAC